MQYEVKFADCSVFDDIKKDYYGDKGTQKDFGRKISQEIDKNVISVFVDEQGEV